MTQEAESWCQLIWGYCNFLQAGCPAKLQDAEAWCQRALSNKWTEVHQSHTSAMFSAVLEFCSLEVPDTPSRGIKKVNELVEMMTATSYHNVGACHWQEMQQAARFVDPERMSLPERAGILDPADYLKGPELEQFTHMDQRVPIEIVPTARVRPCHRVRKKEVVPVYSKLLQSGVAVLLPEEAALHDASGRLISGGLFAVAHKQHSDRVINDRRPFNQGERRLVWARLPHGTLLTQLVLGKEFSVRASGDDLKNYFYLLKHIPEWLPRNVVGHPVSGADFARFGADPARRYVLAFKVVCMGDLNGVDICQQTHVELLRDCGVMRPEHVLEYQSPLPVEPTLEGLYIDDHIVVQVTPKKRHRRKDPDPKWHLDEQIVKQSRQQYERLGIPVSTDKRFTKQSQLVPLEGWEHPKPSFASSAV